MSARLTITLIVGVVFYLCIIIVMIRKEQLSLKYTLLWLLSAVVMLVLAAIPQVSKFMAKAMGVETPANAVFAVVGLFSLLLILSLTCIVSTQMQRIRRLTQTQALLEKRLRDLEAQVGELSEKENEE